MEYKYDFAAICQQVPFISLIQTLNLEHKIEGKTIKLPDAIVTLNGSKAGNDIFKFKGEDKGGSIIDYAMHALGLKSKLKAAQWLSETFLGTKEQKKDIPELTLTYDPYLAAIGISEKIAEDYQVGLVKGHSVMSGRISFKLIDKDNTHRGYIGFDATGKKKVKWYVPEGTKIDDMLFNYNRRNGGDYCILAENPLEAVYLCSIGFPFTLGLITRSITNAQLELMKVFKRVIVIGETPTAHALGLISVCFTKIAQTPVIGKTHDDIKALF